MHGAGGSAGVGILLIAGIGADVEAILALLLFAVGTAASMALVSAAWGRLLVSGAVEQRLAVLVPVLGTASLAFGLLVRPGRRRLIHLDVTRYAIHRERIEP
jgi:hypothetical protein